MSSLRNFYNRIANGKGSPTYNDNDIQGWARYGDTEYTSAAPLTLVAGTERTLPNNAGSELVDDIPRNVQFYENGRVTGRTGDNIFVTVSFTAVQRQSGIALLEVWFDIGGSFGRLFPRLLTFPRGQNTERLVSFTVMGFTLDTWEANGAQVMVKCDKACEIYNISYVISRTYSRK